MDAAYNEPLSVTVLTQIGEGVLSELGKFELTALHTDPIGTHVTNHSPEATLEHEVSVADLVAGLRGVADRHEAKFWPHALEVTIDSDGDVRFGMTCSAPEGASCRLWCAEACEEYSEEHERHEMVDQGRCLRLDWFEDWSIIPESYDGESAPLRPGAVVLSWQDDYYSWHYPMASDS